MDGNTNDPTSNDRMAHHLWGHAWYCIRKCNLGLTNLGNMVGTQEERDLIAGQLYFFRAWWHFELMAYLGGLPYIDQVLGIGRLEPASSQFPRSGRQSSSRLPPSSRPASD